MNVHVIEDESDHDDNDTNKIKNNNKDDIVILNDEENDDDHHVILNDKAMEVDLISESDNIDNNDNSYNRNMILDATKETAATVTTYDDDKIGMIQNINQNNQNKKRKYQNHTNIGEEIIEFVGAKRPKASMTPIAATTGAFDPLPLSSAIMNTNSKDDVMGRLPELKHVVKEGDNEYESGEKFKRLLEVAEMEGRAASRETTTIAPQQHGAHLLLPTSWESTVDPTTGRTYYYSRATGETSWEPPTQKSAQATKAASGPLEEDEEVLQKDVVDISGNNNNRSFLTKKELDKNDEDEIVIIQNNNSSNSNNNNVSYQNNAKIKGELIQVFNHFNSNSSCHPLQQQQQQQEIQQKQRELQIEDALLYLDQVKAELGDRPDIFMKFLDIMKTFKTQQIDTLAVIRRVSNLLRGEKKLVLGLNPFLPEGYKIEFPVDGEGPPVAIIQSPDRTVTHILALDGEGPPVSIEKKETLIKPTGFFSIRTLYLNARGVKPYCNSHI